MERLVIALIAGCALVFGCAAASVRRPAVDVSAMREAMSSARVAERMASSASYAHFLKARLAHHDGDHRRAVDELRLALATDEGNPFLLTGLAEEHARLDDLPQAERVLRRAIKRRPRYRPAQLLMGRVLFEARRPGLARRHLRAAIALDPRAADAYLVLAQVELDAGAPDMAVKVVEELSAALPGEAMGYRRLGLVLAERGDLARAEGLLAKAVERDPGDFESWVALARLYEATARPREAEAAYDRALERDPDNQAVLLAAGRLLLRGSAPGRARAYLDRLLSLTDDPEVTVKVAYSYFAAHQIPEAAEVLDAARRGGQVDPYVAFYAGVIQERLRRYVLAADAYAEVPAASKLYPEARVRRADCLSMAGAHAQALAIFEQEAKARPELPPLLPAWARALERAGRPGEAEVLLTRELQVQPAPELTEALAGLYERQGRLQEAIGLLVGALTRRPRDEVLLYALGVTYQRGGRLEESIEKMRAVLEVNPGNAAAMNFIGYTLADSGRNLDEAERLLNRALELRPDSGAFLDSLGWLYFRRGEAARAVDTLERATRLSPDEPLIIEHLGDAYLGAARTAQAVEAYRRAFEALAGVEDAAEARTLRSQLERKLKMLSSEAAGR